METFTQEYLYELIESIKKDFIKILEHKIELFCKSFVCISIDEFVEWEKANTFSPAIQKALCEYTGLTSFNDCISMIKHEAEHEFNEIK